MNILSTIFRSCLQPRKPKPQPETPPAVPPKDPAPYTHPHSKQKDLTKRPSIRIVSKEDSTESPKTSTETITPPDTELKHPQPTNEKHHQPEPPATENTPPDSTTPNDLPPWRQTRRKSLIELINLLQTTAATAPKLSQIRLPTPRRRGSMASFASGSSATVTEEEPRNAKKERRMGTVMFPGVRFGTRRWAEESLGGRERRVFC
ncbi:hypothetical protein BDV28DRAFT_120357 [Aspergillus coremiiformis]|uniref:Uncharacterized protein n=1 Tax=Aspergillus coremiiformis TaxID=138285 RepID=A0A5N6Z5R7_9EURO|nr:hypothetical protein BDV28DRAFT_120357 [Aspergillus coremiiformis]